MAKITFITTTDHNIGDDFIRLGLQYLLKKHFDGQELKFQCIHKHSPITTRSGMEWFRFYRLSKIVDPILPLGNKDHDKIMNADLVVQAGTPVYWCHPNENAHCAQNEWYVPLIKRRYQPFSQAAFINLAAGSCQKFFSDGGEVAACPCCSPYIKEITGISKITTVRDNVAKKILNQLGLDAPLLPCPSIFARKYLNINPVSNPPYIALNFMAGGAHHTFGQDIDFKKWEEIMKKFYNFLKDQKEQACFVCHSKNEMHIIKEMLPDAAYFFATTPEEYLRFFSNIKFGIMNRIHGAFPISSFGRPCLLIGSDSRTRMAKEIDVPYEFVNNVTLEKLIKFYEQCRKDPNSYEPIFQRIEKEAEDGYLSIFSDHCLQA